MATDEVAGPTLSLADGTYHAFPSRAVVHDDELRSVEVEIIEVFDGDDAVAAAIEDGFANSAADLDGPVYVRRSDIVGLLPVASDVAIEILDPAPERLRPATIDEFVYLYNDYQIGPGQSISPHPIELTVVDGVVTHIAQFYLS